jgi:uncharacterized protein
MNLTTIPMKTTLVATLFCAVSMFLPCARAQQNEADREALAGLRTRAEKGDARAQFNLGDRYRTGEGVTQDMVEAVKWYRKAAEQNHAMAQNNLGGCYFNGQGVAQDYLQAYKWCSLASSQGEENAWRNLPFFMLEMTSEQIAEAQRLVQEFKSRESREPGASPSGQALKP